ncbi:MAG: bifunctional 3-(3-hydroxy-phenyl)propionate/3-hydroxycinnamic acid hydroxylase [Gammaproteobacteria bacterium]|nr:bifunctional 3-(3-hydroxy-phenyl)propionate/3-hydroxycinnamic acid hydroxylase [Gammaproteobacteria bacterium]
MKRKDSAQTSIDYDHDIVIIGCGPTGATLANLIAQSGANVLVIDKESTIYDLPRAVHFDDETMRVFQSVGISEELLGKVRVNPGMRFVDSDGSILLDWPRSAAIWRQGWHSSYRLHQPDLEFLLRGALAQYANCTLRLGYELLALEQSDTAVELTYRNKANENTVHCKTKFVVGCDGANSSVRAAMHTKMEDLGFNERWLVLDVLLNQDMPELGDHTIQYCSAEQPMTYCRNPGLRRRWEMALSDSQSNEQVLDISTIWSSLSRWITPQEAKLERKAIYTFRSQLAHHWRDRRIFIAGDAAHLTPPFMGQGMCAGIRDASNLAWKLTMVLQSECADTLLDSYEQERRPHAREYITTAIALGKLINSLERESVRSITSEGDLSELQMASIAPSLGSTNIVAKPYRLRSHIGKLFDQIIMNDGTRLDDRVGYRHVLISHAGTASVDVKPASQQELTLSVGDQELLSNLLDQWQVESVFIRPDRYILATSNDVHGSAELNWQSLLFSALPLASDR